MAFSYSFHLSSKGHAVGTVGKLGQVSKHNLRAYKSAEDYDKNLISVIKGSTTSILDSVKEIYEQEFSGALEEYNSKKRADRQINNYLEHVSQSRNDVAAEIIIQIGDKEFWQDKTPEQFRSMENVFKEQMKDLEKLLPEFKVASAVVHYDESSPHMHVVGVPVAEGGVRGMKKQCVKTKVFTTKSLAMLQEQMRLKAILCMDSMPELFVNVELKEKETGRNRDYPKYMMDKINAAEKEVNTLKKDVIRLKKDISGLKTDKTTLQAEISNLEAEKDALDVHPAVLIKKFLELSKIKPIFDRFVKQERESIKEYKGKRESVKAKLSRYQDEVDMHKQEKATHPERQHDKKHENER